MKNEATATADFGPYEPEAWRFLGIGDSVTVANPISETEKALQGRRFTITRFTEPNGFAVVSDEHGSWWVHPEALAR